MNGLKQNRVQFLLGCGWSITVDYTSSRGRHGGVLLVSAAATNHPFEPQLVGERLDSPVHGFKANHSHNVSVVDHLTLEGTGAGGAGAQINQSVLHRGLSGELFEEFIDPCNFRDVLRLDLPLESLDRLVAHTYDMGEGEHRMGRHNISSQSQW